MCHLDKEHAKYILNKLLLLQDIDIKIKLEAILKDILEEGLFDYDEDELNIINATVVEINTGVTPIWKGEKVDKEFVISGGTGKPKPKRDPQKAANALAKANYLCEYDLSDKVFLRKNGTSNYAEPHHLIRISNHAAFNFNLDVEENIVSFCSLFNNLLDYGEWKIKNLY
ncbi:hypothetical protein [Clostridium diolis]|uniref:hypothetical protein n=1 Tax=Clostridium diolis TaxID=223919 RepID=UPI003AF9E7E9